MKRFDRHGKGHFTLAPLGTLLVSCMALLACNDGGAAPFACSEQGVREAIAAGGGVHTFACDGPTVVVTSGEIEIDTDVVLDGGGNLILDGADDHRVLVVASGRTVELQLITVQHGLAADPNPSGASDRFRHGGGIHNLGTLVLRRCIVRSNEAEMGGGGIYSNRGSLTLIDSRVRENEAFQGAGIFAEDGLLSIHDGLISDNVAEIGGGISVLADITPQPGNSPGPVITTLVDVDIVDNDAPIGAGVAYEAFVGGSLMTIEGVTISYNGDSSISKSLGGGLFVHGQAEVHVTNSLFSVNAAEFGGGIYNRGALRVEATTFEANAGRVGGALYNTSAGGNPGLTDIVNATFWSNGLFEFNTFGGAVYNAGTLTIAHGTFMMNWAETGKAIRNVASLNLRSSYLVGDCAINGGTATGAFNAHRSNTSCPGSAVASPGLAQYGDIGEFGGPTPTIPLLGGVTVDFIPFSDCVDAYGVPVLVDQRGESRTAGGACDVGAFEIVP